MIGMPPTRVLRWGALGGALALGTLGLWNDSRLAPRVAIAQAPAPQPPPALEVLGFGGDGESDFTRLLAVSPTGARELGRVIHQPGSSVKGALLGNGRVAAVAQRSVARERSWTGALYLLVEGRTETLLDAVYEGSWPVALDEARVLVARGTPGLQPVELQHQQRIDDVFVDEYDVATRTVKRLYQSRGYLALPIGQHDHQTYLADIGPGGVSLVAVTTQGRVRVVADGLQLARDFSLDKQRNAVYCQVRHPRQPSLWQVIEIDLPSGRVQPVLDGNHYAMVPARWPIDGLLALNPVAGEGLALFDPSTRRVRQPSFQLGHGIDEVAAVAADGRGVAILHHGGPARPQLYLVDAQTQRAFPVPIPREERRFEVVGVVPQGGAR